MVRNREYAQRGGRGVRYFGEIPYRLPARGKIRLAGLRREKFCGIFPRKTVRKQKIGKTRAIKSPAILAIKRKTLDKTAPIWYYIYSKMRKKRKSAKTRKRANRKIILTQSEI